MRVRQGSGAQRQAAPEEELSIGRQIYKHLMNGVSHMLPLVVAGGVLTAISFLWGIYSFDPESSQYNEIAALLKSIGGYSMGLMVPVLTAFIAQSISGRPGMLAGLVAGMIASETGSGFIGGIIGGFLAGYFVLWLIKVFGKLPRQLEGLKSIFMIPIVSVGAVGAVMVLLGNPCSALNNMMMEFLANLQNSNPLLLGVVVGCMSAFDMGGPVNKAAYVTGTMLLGQGNYLFMAGVSAACITPPLIIALAATFWKNRFTKDDRAAGLINYVLGCTHITEGAIPFAAKNPLKVLPVLMIGSSVSAVLSYLMEIEVPAPHGGFLILGLVNKPLLWVGCILVGSAIGAVLYVLVTPKVVEAAEASAGSLAVSGGNAGTVSRTEAKPAQSLYHANTVTLQVKGKTKDEVIEEMASLLEKDGTLTDKETFKKAIYEREAMSTTGMGMGIAIPHAKTNAVKIPRVAVGISKEGFDFASEDGEPAHLVFMIATNENGGDLHLKTLAELSGKLMHEEFTDSLMNAKSREEIVRLLENK